MATLFINEKDCFKTGLSRGEYTLEIKEGEISHCANELPELLIRCDVWNFVDEKCFGYIKNDLSTIQMLLNEYDKQPHIEKVIFKYPATIIKWTDGTKTVVKCQLDDAYDREKGFVMAYLKKLLGNDNTFNKEINKWVYGGK